MAKIFLSSPLHGMPEHARKSKIITHLITKRKAEAKEERERERERERENRGRKVNPRKLRKEGRKRGRVVYSQEHIVS